jgi:hypothetical protein
MNELPGKIEAHLKTTPLASNLTSLFCETLRWGAPRGMAIRRCS